MPEKSAFIVHYTSTDYESFCHCYRIEATITITITSTITIAITTTSAIGSATDSNTRF